MAPVVVFAGTVDRLYRLDNTNFTWRPVSAAVGGYLDFEREPGRVISFTNSFAANDPVVFSTTGVLPAGLTAGTVYYVAASGLSSSAFSVAATPGGALINTSSAGSGTTR